MLVDWTFWGSGIILGIFGLWVMYRAIFADRSRGRRRCPKCWYDMSESPEMRCPECGSEALNDREFFRTRRRWKGLWVSIVILLAAYVLWMQPEVRRDGWASLTPRMLLILALRFPENEWAFARLELRTQSVYPTTPGAGMKAHDPSTLYQWQWRMVGNACIELSRENPDIATRLLLIKWLRRVADTQDIKTSERYNAVIYGYLTDKNASVRQRAALYCADSRSPEQSIKMIQPLLNDPNQRVRISAASGLRILSAYSSAPLASLLGALEHDDDQVRMFAAAALGDMARNGHASVDTFNRLVELYENDPAIYVQVRALNAICQFESQRDRIAPHIRSAIANPEKEIRHEAIRMLSEIEPFDEALYLDVTLAGLQEESVDIRALACWMLRYQVITECLRPHRDLLKTLAKNEDWDIREAAKFHLSRLSEANEESADNHRD